MKKKQEYSLTAQERKRLRREEAEKQQRAAEKRARADEKVEVADTAEAAIETEEQPAEAQAATPRRLWIPITGAILALIIILTAVLLLVLPRNNSKYPRAIITLSDGRQLTVTVWEEECPIAATNFLFLAQIGFFDGTIIYDVEEGKEYMRFGDRTGYGSRESKYLDDEFIAGIPKSMFNVVNLTQNSYKNNAQSNLFGYRLQKDQGGDKNRYGEAFALSYNNYNAADFVVNLGEGNTNFTNPSGSNNIKDNLVAFGKFEDEESQKILTDIYGLNKIKNTGLDNTMGTDPQIVIRKVEVQNLNKKKWKNFEFVSYMNTAYNDGAAWSSWRA